MGIFNTNRQNKAAKNTGWDGLSQQLNKVWTRPPKRDVGQLPELFHTSPRLSPVGAISRALASTDYGLFDKVDYRKNKESAELIVEHDVLNLLDNPIPRYPEMDGFSLFYLTEALCKLVGEAFWLKIYSDGGKVIELDFIPPAWVMGTPTIGNPYFIVYPYGTTAGRAMNVPVSDMVYFKRPNLSDPYGRGRGDSEPLEDELQTDEYLAKMQASFAYNDATPPYIISAPGMPKDQAEAFKNSWIEKLGGYLKRRQPGVIGFDAKVLQLGITPVELDMMESRKFIRDMSSEHYQIPPEILGRIENSNRSTIDSAFFLYQKNVLSFEYGFVERTINRQLIAPDFDKNLIFKFMPEIPEDEAHKLSVMSAGLSAGAVMVDEWRKSFKLPPLENNKGKVFLRPFSVYEISADSKDTTPAKPAQTENIPQEKPLTDEEKSMVVVHIIDDEPVRIVDKAESDKEARLTAIWKSFDARATEHENEFIEAVKRFAKDQKKRVIDATESIEKESDVDKALDAVFGEAANKALKSALAPAWLSTLEDGKKHAEDLLGKKKATDNFMDLANKWVEQFGLIKAVEINTTTYDNLRKNLQAQISEALSLGENLYQMKKRILAVCDQVYDNMTAARAVLISRTESGTCINAGSFIQAQAEGVQTKTWLSARDDRTRGSDIHDEFNHVSADGETVNINEPFMRTGEPLEYPGDPNGSAGNICNCRCSILYNE